VDKGDKRKDDGDVQRQRVTLEGFAASVELPEGHQLIIGELPAGTVLEVATWQGVGRPDESTNRFLLTADGPGLQPRRRDSGKSEAQETTAEPVVTPPAPAAPVAPEPVFVSEPEPTPEPVVMPEPIPEPEPEPDVAAESVEENISFVQSSRPLEDFLGVHIPAKEEAVEVQFKSRPARGSGKWKAAGRTFFSAAASLAIVLIILNIVGISMTVPTISGNSSFGNLTTSLVLYKRGNSLDNGAPTVAIVKSGKTKEIVLGKATIFGARQLTIGTTRGQVLVDADSVVGHSIVAIPGLGWILGPIFH
jgi:hypothetical protein